MDPEAVRANRRTWDAIADSFDATRRRPWPPVVEFLEGFPAGAWVLDAGTGNGRHARTALARGLRTVGMDLSRPLLRRAVSNAPGLQGVEAILERLPFRTETFEAVICVATLHQIRGRRHRLEAWRELRHVLRPGGPAFVSVWARDQPRFRTQPPRPPSMGVAEEGDAEIGWNLDGHQVARFYHLYTLDELKGEAEEAGFRVERAWSPTEEDEEVAGNHFALLRRTAHA